MIDVRIRTLSSLAKVFPNEYPPYMECRSLTALQNESTAFQVAVCVDFGQRQFPISVHCEGDLNTELYRVECVPSDLPIYPGHDGNLVCDRPGMYPDLLRPTAQGEAVRIGNGEWTAFWIDLPGHKAAGRHVIKVTVSSGEDVLGEVQMLVDILPADLPEQTLLHTSWFHTDCLSTWYQVEPMSEEYWRITENYAKVAREHGLNLILTPIFTPPLDTEVGKERPTVQLIDVRINNGRYSFGFENLHRWIEMCHRVGIENFELAHFFTQWGAAHAPKIMAWVDGKHRRIFGWETDSLGEDYSNFLKELAKELIPFLEAEGVAEHCYLHVSDEPSDEVIDQYSMCARIINNTFPGFKVIDALSHTNYYEKGIIRCPIPKTNAVEEFEPLNIEHKWCYYCCGQFLDVSNRFFAMPQARTRILGMQLYKYGMEGFLQWGFNFWYSQLSKNAIDPFRVTDAGRAFPSGDAFVVYPGENGTPLVSIRLKAFYEGFNDMRALQLLEKYIGRARTLKLLEKGLKEPITFKNYPHTEDWLLAKRAEINRAIRREIWKHAHTDL